MSLGNILQALAPIAAGALVPGGATLLGSAALPSIAAGAATGAGIAALSGDDPLMGAVSGGLGGFSGGQLSGAASSSLAPTTTTALPTGMVDQGLSPALQNSTFSGVNANSIGTQFTPTAGVNKGISMADVTMPNTGKALGSFSNPSGSYLNRLGGGSTLKGAGKLGAAGLPVIGAAAMPDYNQTEDPMSKYDPKRRLNLGMTTGIQNAMNRDSGLRLNQPFARFAQGGRAGVDYDSTRPSGGNMELMDKPFFGETGMDFFNIERVGERMTPGVDPFYPEADKMMIMRRQLDNEIGQLSEELRMQGPFLTDDSRRELETEINAKIYARNIAEPTFERQTSEDEDTKMDMQMREYRLGMQEGGYLDEGAGDGMSDEIMGNIDGIQPVRLSEGEFVVPADVVSHLGNGDSDSGSEQLYAMMDRVRQARTGSKKQGKQIKAERLMPA